MSEAGLPPNTVTVNREIQRVQDLLAVPFPPDEIKVKPAMVKGNRALALSYIDARCVMDRLDEVVGVSNWQDAYTVLPGGEVECRLSLRIGGEWVTKADVGGQSEQPDDGDKMKAAYSDALKRVAVKFGIGRHLYRMKQEWLDYDPVKKQIIRPQQQPRGGQHKQPAMIGNMAANLSLRADFVKRLRECASRDAYLEVCKGIADAVKSGNLTPEDRELLTPIARETSSKFPAPQQQES